MSFLTDHMETMLRMATDPEEIELRRKVLDDHLAADAEQMAKRAEMGEPLESPVLADPATLRELT